MILRGPGRVPKLHKLLFGIVCLAVAGATSAATTLRFADFGPNRGDRAAALEWFADQVRTRSTGRLDIEFHWGGALVSTKDALKGVADGVADIGSVVGYMTPKELYGYNIGDLPVDNADEWVGMRAMYRLATGSKMMRDELAKAGVVYISNFTTGPLQLICRKEVKSLAELKGLKVRASGPYGKVFGELGASVQSMAQDKVFEALDTGVIDCNQNYFYSIRAYKQNEVASYVLELDWAQNMSFGIVMNKGAYEALPEADRRVLVEVGADFVDHLAKVMIARRTEDKAALTDGSAGKAVKLLQLNAVDRAALVSASQRQSDEWVAKGGSRAEQLMRVYLGFVRELSSEKATNGYPWTR